MSFIGECKDNGFYLVYIDIVADLFDIQSV